MVAAHQPDEGFLGQQLEKIIKVLTVVFLIAFSLLLISIYQTQLEEYIFYIHFLYLPIVLATFWWGKQGIGVATFLGGVVIAAALLSRQPAEEVFSSLMVAALFVIVAALVGMLSDEKRRALEEEQCFKRNTAHYFFNPICIAEGNLDLAQKKAPSNLSKELDEMQKAVSRIKKVVINVVEKGEIRE